MDLFELQAKLKLDDSAFNKGIESAISAGERMKGSMSAATVAVGNLTADLLRKGVSAISGTIKGAMEGFANYQQLIGGVETLFKGSAKRVAAYASQSYKTAGLSANDYMETVTSFSASLLQGLGGDTEAAAELANTAIIDMADNANKMGTDMASIQNAYQGFAKGNYTMLDNLKLGYGGTKGEMVRLVNESGILQTKIEDLDGITFDQLIQAIHAVQTNMGITGTTAKEAEETISGSAASMKAAWSDMLTAIGSDDGSGEGISLDEAIGHFQESFSQYMDNWLPTMQTTLGNSETLITALAGAITDIAPEAIATASTNMTGIVEGSADGAKALTGWIIDSLVESITTLNQNPEKVTEMGTAVGEFLGSTISDIVKAGPKVVPQLFLAGVNLAGSLISGLYSGLIGADEGVYGAFDDADKEMANTIREATQSASEAQGIISYLQGLVDEYGDAAKNTDEWANALSRLNEVMPGANEYIQIQNGTVQSSIEYLKREVELLKERAIQKAKEKALQDKQEAYATAVTDLATARYNLEIEQSRRTNAQKELISFIRQYDPMDAGSRDENGNYIYSDSDLIARYDNLATTAMKKLENAGLQTEEFESAKIAIDGFADDLNESETNIISLQDSMGKLEAQVTYAESRLKVAEAAIDDLAGAAGTAADILATIKAPRIVGVAFTGDYNPYTDGIDMNPHHHATGLDYVPYNGYQAELHRGEAVLTSAENQSYQQSKAQLDDIIGEMQEMRQDLQNFRLIVGKKTFARAVVDYSGRRMDDYIGETEARRATGYGALSR